MSLEEAAKELEKLELRMHQRAVGNEDEGGGKINTSVEDCGFNNKSTVRASVGEAEGESKDGDDDVKMNRDSRDVFRRRRPVTAEGRKGCPAMGERGENGSFPRDDRSPTRTPPRNTGGIDIEGQGHLPSPSRSKSQNTVGLSATGTATVDAWRCSRDAPWVTGEVDRNGGVRSSFGGDNLSFSAVGAKGVGEIPRGVTRGWRNETDVDLSDIKAAMRRIDGAGAGVGVGVGELTHGYANNTFAFDTRVPIASAAAAASSRSATGLPFAAGVSLDREPFASRSYGARDVRFGSDLFSSSIAAGGKIGEGSGKWGGDFGRSPCSGASYGSKAVLGSLRALQDKIRKLESERDRASVEAGTLRREIAALKSNHERAAQISESQAQEKTLTSRLAYERLQADKIAVDVRLRKAEEHKNILMREAEAAKERSVTAEAARQTAESRVRILEDSLKGSGRQHEETKAAEARALEEATATAKEKAGKIEALRCKVEKLESSVAAEKTLHEEAEDRLKQALSDKGKLEHFLEGILRVNEELVKAKANNGGDKKRTKVKRPKVGTTAYCGGGGGGRGGGGHDGEDFNFGTHTAKRATLRARKGIVKKNRVVRAAAAADPSTRGVLKQRKSTSTCKVAKRESIVKNGRTRSVVEVAVPFVASGSGKDSFNVVSAVSKAVRAARRGRPHESLDVIYAEIERAAVENTRDVASMFDDRNGGTSCRQQQRRSQIRSPRRVASADRKGRGVLDVSMPDLRGLNLDSPNFSDQRSVEVDGREDGLEASGSNHHWRRSIGLNEAPKTPSRREGDQRRKVGVLRRGTQGGEREHPEECFGYGEAYYGMWSSGRFGDVADVDGKDKEDENEDKQQEGNGRDGARFCSQAGGGKGSPAMDASMSSGDERERAWESLDSRTRSRSSRLA